jgi:hypothetical protein
MFHTMHVAIPRAEIATKRVDDFSDGHQNVYLTGLAA